jgi:hypothetical protein
MALNEVMDSIALWPIVASNRFTAMAYSREIDSALLPIVVSYT